MSTVQDNCDICHLPFSHAGRNSVTKLGIGDRWYLMCGDCRKSLEQWRRTQEEAGLETREKNF
jgi:hypothetical protein